jgi:hypothetical protein
MLSKDEDIYRRCSLPELERIGAISRMGPNGIVRTADAQLYCSVSAPTWIRWRREGVTPPAIRLTEKSFGYRKCDLDAFLKARLEKSDAAA